MGKVGNVLNTIGAAAKKYSPEILTGVGIVGMISTTVLAVRATPKALIILEDKKREKKLEAIGTDKTGVELTRLEVVKSAWKCYIPATVTGVCSVACLVGASSINARRHAALLAAYTLSETALSDYKDKVVETFGEKKAQEVRDAIAKEKVDSNPVDSNEIVLTDKGESLCYDAISGRYFKSDIEWIRRCVNNLNERLLFDTYVSLNEFYDEIGLDEISIGDKLGWTVNPDSSDKGLISLNFTSQIASDGTPCLVVGFLNSPVYDYAH